MAVKKLSLFPAGYCHVDQTILDTRLTPGVKTTLPIWVYLIETTDGPILVDTGMPASCITDPDSFFKGTEDEGLIVPEMQEEHLVTEILHRTGYQPEQLLFIISSHLHFDHAGGNALFPKTEIVLQQTEYDVAMQQANYFDICKKNDLNYKFVQGDVELVPGVDLLFTPGHTPGHQSLLVQTEQTGPILLTIDASYTRANFEDGVPFATSNQEDADNSIKKLREIAQSEKASLFFGHDQQQGKEWKTYPFFY